MSKSTLDPIIKKELQLKKKLLKIFINAEHIINSARFSKYWKSSRIYISQIENLYLSRRGKDSCSKNYIFYTTTINKQKPEESNSISISKNIFWGEQSGSIIKYIDAPKHDFIYKQIHISFSLIKGTKEQGRNIPLGSVDFTLKDFKNINTQRT